MWCVAEVNEAYLERMEDVLELYERPYNPQEPVVCLDEKPVVLHRDMRPATPAQPQQPAKRDYQYKRCGTANVFCAVEPLAGRHLTWSTPNRSGRQFAKMLQRIAKTYPNARTIHLVLDNLSTHAAPLCAFSARTKPINSGTDSPSTTPQNMPVGSIRQRSKSASSPANAWAPGALNHYKSYGLNPPLGIVP
jgi:hypothetical protein